MQLAISDAHPRLMAAIARVLGSPWQRCTVHFLRDLRGHCRKDQHDALGALIRQIFTAPEGTEARRRLADAISRLEPRLPKIARLLDEAEDDIRELGRRTDVVGIFPDDQSMNPPGLDARDRCRRRMARRTQLHQPRLDGHALRDPDRSTSLSPI